MTAEVNEFLKTCRLYYRMLVTVCIAALLFAIAPSDSKRFQQAIQEAELVSEMDVARLLNEGVREHDEVGAYIEKITAVMSAAGIIYEGSEYQTLFGELFELPITAATIDKLQRYILQAQSAIFRITQDDSWFDEVKQKIANLGSNRKTLSKLELGGNRTRLEFTSATHDEFNVDTKLKHIEVTVDLIEVIKRNSKNGQLVQVRKGNQPIVFPRLHAFWQEVRDLKPREAVSYLAYRKANTIDNIAFLGLSIPAYLAGIVVPLAIFVVLLHLYIYMRILSKLMKSKEDAPHEQIGFPWLPLFTDRVSQTLTFIYNPLLPIIANILILRRSLPTGYFWTSLIAILMTLAAAILGVLLYAQKTRKLHLLA